VEILHALNTMRESIELILGGNIVRLLGLS
jgi:hypothetical protein